MEFQLKYAESPSNLDVFMLILAQNPSRFDPPAAFIKATYRQNLMGFEPKYAEIPSNLDGFMLILTQNIKI